jgi:hypothetical protein
MTTIPRINVMSRVDAVPSPKLVPIGQLEVRHPGLLGLGGAKEHEPVFADLAQATKFASVSEARSALQTAFSDARSAIQASEAKAWAVPGGEALAKHQTSAWIDHVLGSETRLQAIFQARDGAVLVAPVSSGSGYGVGMSHEPQGGEDVTFLRDNAPSFILQGHAFESGAGESRTPVVTASRTDATLVELRGASDHVTFGARDSAAPVAN